MYAIQVKVWSYIHMLLQSSGLELSCSSLTKDLEELRLSKSELEYQNTSLEKKNLELNDHNKTLEVCIPFNLFSRHG